MLDSFFRFLCCTDRAKGDAEQKYKNMQKRQLERHIRQDSSFNSSSSSSSCDQNSDDESVEPVRIGLEDSTPKIQMAAQKSIFKRDKRNSILSTGKLYNPGVIRD